MKPKSNRVYSRYKFLSRTQKEVETFEKFLTDLILLIKECKYQDQDDMIRDAIVFGIQKVREKCIGEGSELIIGSVNVNDENHDAEWYETVKVKDTYIHFKLYTGAKCNVVSLADLKKKDKNLKVVPTFSPLRSFSLCWHC